MKRLNVEFLTVSFSDERKQLVTVAMYYGVIVKMMLEVQEDSTPLLTAHYGDHEAAIDFRDCSIVKGSLPPKQSRLVFAWIEIHREDLEANWRLIAAGEEPFRIAPLQ